MAEQHINHLCLWYTIPYHSETSGKAGFKYFTLCIPDIEELAAFKTMIELNFRAENYSRNSTNWLWYDQDKVETTNFILNALEEGKRILDIDNNLNTIRTFTPKGGELAFTISSRALHKFYKDPNSDHAIIIEFKWNNGGKKIKLEPNVKEEKEKQINDVLNLLEIMVEKIENSVLKDHKLQLSIAPEKMKYFKKTSTSINILFTNFQCTMIELWKYYGDEINDERKLEFAEFMEKFIRKFYYQNGQTLYGILENMHNGLIRYSESSDDSLYKFKLTQFDSDTDNIYTEMPTVFKDGESLNAIKQDDAVLAEMKKFCRKIIVTIINANDVKYTKVMDEYLK